MAALPIQSKLLELPDALLIDIALSFDTLEANQNLRQLALTCRQFRSIAREALVCTAVVTPAGVRGYIQLLLQYPENIPKVRRLYLYATQAHFLPTRSHSRIFWDAERDDSDRIDILKKLYSEHPQIVRVRATLKNRSQTQQDMLLALFTLLPNLTDLLLLEYFLPNSPGLNCLKRHYVRLADHLSCRPSDTIKALGSMITKLDLIDLPRNIREFCYRFVHLSNLKELSVLADHLIYDALFFHDPISNPHSSLSEPSAVLPNSVEVLKLYIERRVDCDIMRLVAWMKKALDPSQALTSLRCFHLFFRMTFETFAILMSPFKKRLRYPSLPANWFGRSGMSHYPQLKKLAEIEKAGAHLKTYFWKMTQEEELCCTVADREKQFPSQDPSLFMEVSTCEVFKLPIRATTKA